MFKVPGFKFKSVYLQTYSWHSSCPCDFPLESGSIMKVLHGLVHAFHIYVAMEFLCSYRPSAGTFLVLSKGNINTSLKCLCGLCCKAQITSKTCIMFAGKPKTGGMAVLSKQGFPIIREKSKRQSAKCTIPETE